MGMVYRAKDVVLDTKVVVKVPHVRFLDDVGFLGRFEREIKSLTRLEHPHVVRVIDTGVVTRATPSGEVTVPYAVLQYLAGGACASASTTRAGGSPRARSRSGSGPSRRRSTTSTTRGLSTATSSRGTSSSTRMDTSSSPTSGSSRRSVAPTRD